MTAFIRTQLGSVWAAGYAPLQADLQDFESKVQGGINGDEGGTYAPTTPIVFTTGAGQTIVTGPLKVCYGARFTTLSGARFVVPGAQFEQFAPGHVGASRTLPAFFVDADVWPPAVGIPDPVTGSVQIAVPRVHVDLAPPPANVGVLWTTGPFEDQAARTTAELCVHNGATLASVTLTYVSRLGMPRARLVRYDSGGNLTPITLQSVGADVDGWTKLPAADPTLAVQAVTFICDPGVVVDTALYWYAIQIEEDQTASDKVYLLKQPARLATTLNLELLQDLPIIDGVQTVAGDIVLLRAQSDATQNGLWYIVGSGNHFVPVGATSISSTFVFSTVDGVFPAGYLVPVREGLTLGGTIWQMTSKSGLVGRLAALNSSSMAMEQPFAIFTPTGNTYLAAAANHIGIIDTRWQ